MARLLVGGEVLDLGVYPTAEAASEAFVGAKMMLGAQAEAAAEAPQRPVKKYRGVMYDRDTGEFEAVLGRPDGTEVSGGTYATAEEAARGYDALARMYGGPDVQVNFEAPSQYAEWVPPTVHERAAAIPVKAGEPLSPEDIVQGLTALHGEDVQHVDVTERWEMGAAMGVRHLIFATGRSVAHMRRMADAVVRALHLRGLTPPSAVQQWAVENRDGDDWMVVDTGAVVVNVMDEVTRRAFDLERMYKNMQWGEGAPHAEDPQAWLADNPLPDEWVRRLESDEAEFHRAVKAQVRKVKRKGKR